MAISSIVNKHRALFGWTIYSPREMGPIVVAWAEVLDRARVPVAQYNELYLRSVDLRRRRLENGLDCPPFSAELLLACWTELAREIRQREIDARSSLPASAEALCKKCFGKGKEFVYDEKTGRVLGVRRGRCDHRTLEDG